MKDAKKGTASQANANSARGKFKSGTAATAQASEGNKSSSGTQASGNADAETLLKADHRKVEKLFEQYKNAGEEDEKKEQLAKQICSELIVHSTLEEEIFYPACREKDVEDDDLDEAQVEHDGAKVMIAELMNGSPSDEYFDAKVTVLSEYIKHHVGEEERASDGIFAKARKAGVDMNAIGARIQTRKSELMEDMDSLSSTPPEPKSLQVELGQSSTSNRERSMARYSNRDQDDQGYFTGGDYGRGNRSSSSRGGYSSSSRYGEDEEYGSRGQSGGGGYNRGNQYDDDDYGSGRRGGSSGGYAERNQMGRSMSGQGGGGQGYSRSGYSSRSSQEDMDEGSYGRGSRGGYGQQDEGSRYMSGRSGGSQSSSRGGYSSRSSQYDDDDYRSGGSSGGSRGQGGWFGDSEGHSEAAQRGWENREGGRSMSQSRRGSSSYDDDDYRGSSSSRSGSGRSGGDEGQGGWFGDSEGHSRAARRGWQNR